MRTVVIVNETKDTTLATAEWRGTVIGRARGLLGRGGLGAGEGIVIDPCSSVHMFFMRFALDVVYVDREGRVVKTVAGLRPFRLSVGGRKAHQTIELAVGTIAKSGTEPGDQLRFHDTDQLTGSRYAAKTRAEWAVRRRQGGRTAARVAHPCVSLRRCG